MVYDKFEISDLAGPEAQERHDLRRGNSGGINAQYAARIVDEAFDDAVSSGSAHVGMMDINMEGTPISQHLESGSYTIRESPHHLKLAPEDPTYLKAFANKYEHLHPKKGD